MSRGRILIKVLKTNGFQNGLTLNRAVDFWPAESHDPGMSPPEPDLDQIFAALADRTRRAILSALAEGDRTVGALAEPHAMSLAGISKHVGVLARAGLLAQEKVGRVVTCRLLPDGMRTAGIWMQGVGGFDVEDYDTLERLLARVLGEEPDEGEGEG